MAFFVGEPRRQGASPVPPAPPFPGRNLSLGSAFRTSISRSGTRQLNRRMIGQPFGLLECEFLVATFVGRDVDQDRVPGLVLVPQDLLRQRILDHALDRPTKRTGSES